MFLGGAGVVFLVLLESEPESFFRCGGVGVGVVIVFSTPTD